MPLDNMEQIIDQLGRAHADFKQKVETELAEVKAGVKAAPADLAKVNEALDRLSSAKDALEAKHAAEQKRLDDLEKRLNRPGGGGEAGNMLEAELKSMNDLLRSHAGVLQRPMGPEIDADGLKSYREGFKSYLRGGDNRLSDAERKAMSSGSNPDGGYLVHADTTGRIVQRVYETSPIRQIANVQTISTDALEGMNDLDQAADMVMLNETTGPSETSTPQVGTWRIPVWEGAVEPRATQKLLEDASVDVEAWLARKTADRIARGQNRRFVLGSGANEPRGFTAYPVATTGDDTRAWGTLQVIGTGVNGDFAASSPGDILFDMVGAFKDAYLQNARWVTRREVITKIRKFKDGQGQYLWQPGLQQGQPQQIIGFPVTVAQDMPTLGASSLSMSFGDFQEGYQIVDRLGITVIRDHLTAKPYVKFWTRVRFGGGVVNFEAIKHIRFA
ncbi:phage major capsid protein [Rhodovarius lipocyclicus]|uniref:phage major capsid protein n=1 Tax=Rhodovarius lipocyclicus TaxID=268410 RepID=UPI001358A7B1|nr:phage major capsid protein [Rhodovarius lipocyclicus]